MFFFLLQQKNKNEACLHLQADHVQFALRRKRNTPLDGPPKCNVNEPDERRSVFETSRRGKAGSPVKVSAKTFMHSSLGSIATEHWLGGTRTEMVGFSRGIL